MMIHAPPTTTPVPSLTRERRHHNTHQHSEAQASNPVKRYPALGSLSGAASSRSKLNQGSDSRRPEPTGWWRRTEAGGESSPQQPHPVHPKFCKVRFGPLQPGSLDFAFHFWPKLGRKGGARTQDSAAGALCLLSAEQCRSLQSRASAPLPSIIHPPTPTPELRVLWLVGCQAVCTPIG